MRSLMQRSPSLRFHLDILLFAQHHQYFLQSLLSVFKITKPRRNEAAVAVTTPDRYPAVIRLSV